LCVGKQDAEAFWTMHDLLFERMDEWRADEDAIERFTEYAAELGLDTDAFAACLLAGETSDLVQRQMDEGRAMGVSGTPAFFVNDWFISGAQPFEVFQQVIEAALQGEHPPPTPTPLPEGASPFDANPEQPGYTYSGDVTFGSTEAEVVLLEFLDFQSADNRNYFLEMWPDLQAEYVEPGKVRVLVKYFPAGDQPAALPAAEAAHCAAQQQAFWPMHDLLFQQQDQWSQADDVPAALKALASELDLDVDAFSTCLDEGQTRDKVNLDVSIALRNQLAPAPQFVVIAAGQANIVPFDELQDAIDGFLEQP
jgi:protein-disulfide isomerase